MAEIPTSDPRDPRFCYCGAARGHYGWQRCKPKESLSEQAAREA